VGMAFFNSFAAATGTWAEARYLALPSCKTHSRVPDADGEVPKQANEERTDVEKCFPDDEDVKATADKTPPLATADKTSPLATADKTSPLATPSTLADGTALVVIEKPGDSPLGVHLVDHSRVLLRGSSVRVASVDSGSVALGRIETGHEVVSVNEVAVTDASHAAELIRTAGGTLRLRVRTPMSTGTTLVFIARRALAGCKKAILREKGTIAWQVGLLALYFVMMLAAGYVMFSIEAGPEAAEAQALRARENDIRTLAGMPLKPAFDADNRTRRQLSPRPRRLAAASSEDAVRAQLMAIGSMGEEEQALAVEEVVQSFAAVVEHQQGSDQYADVAKEMLANCKSQPPDPVSLNWTLNGAIFFMMTVMTTIGYGTFAPETVAGKLIVISVGYISLIVFGIHLGAIQAEIDVLVEWEAEALLSYVCWLEKRVLGKLGRAVRPSRNSETRQLHCKMAAATFTLHCWLAFAALVASSVSGYFNGDQWGFLECYYFAFASSSTIGFGDYAFGPSDGSFLQFFFLLLQAPMIFLGLASFNAFASNGADWITAAGPNFPMGLLGGLVLGLLLFYVLRKLARSCSIRCRPRSRRPVGDRRPLHAKLTFAHLACWGC
jgi:hypothetical protein